MSAIDRSVAASWRLREYLWGVQQQLPESQQFVMHYFDHWLDNSRGKLLSHRIERLIRLALAGGQRIVTRRPIAAECAVFSGKNWRPSIADPRPHYAFFADVVESQSSGWHIEMPWSQDAGGEPQREYLRSHGWGASPLHGVLDASLLRRSLRLCSEVQQALRRHVRLNSEMVAANRALETFVAGVLPYCIWLEESLRTLSDCWQRVYLTGETSLWGRAVLRAFAGRDTEARQHGVVLARQLDYLHAPWSIGAVPIPRKMFVYEDYFATAYEWVEWAGGEVMSWRDPRMQVPPGWSRSEPRWVLFAHQPLGLPNVSRALATARAVAKEQSLPLAVRVHPSASRRERHLCMQGADIEVPNGSLLEQLAGASEVVTVFSTLGYEAGLLGVPVTLVRLGQASVLDAFPPRLQIRETAIAS